MQHNHLCERKEMLQKPEDSKWEVSNLKQKSTGEKGAGREMAWKLQIFHLEKKVLGRK